MHVRHAKNVRREGIYKERKARESCKARKARKARRSRVEDTRKCTRRAREHKR